MTLLDEVAWLFNLRGTDIDFNPGRHLPSLVWGMHDSHGAVFFAYAVVKHDSAVLFVDKTQVDDAVLAHLGQDVEVRPYDGFLPYLEDLVGTGQVKKDQVGCTADVS